MQYGVSVSRELPGAINLTVGYTGSQGKDMFLRGVANMLDPATRAPPGADASARSTTRRRAASTAWSINGIPITRLRPRQLRRAADQRDAPLPRPASPAACSISTRATRARRRARTKRRRRRTRSTTRPSTAPTRRTSRTRSTARSSTSSRARASGRGGWRVGGIVNARSGVPINVTISRPDNITVNGVTWRTSPAATAAARSGRTWFPASIRI